MSSQTTPYLPIAGSAKVLPGVLVPRRSEGERLVGFLLDHNPFYLFSALSMLYGCYLLSSALDVRADEIGKLIWLVVTTNVYEVLLIGLGLYLFVRRGLRRDARMLLILQAFFLADATFLVSEVGSTRIGAGAVLGVVLLGLALGKVYVVFRVLRLERSVRTLGIIGGQLAALLAVPMLLRWIAEDGTLPARPFYGLWWLMLLIPLAQDLLTRVFPPSAEVRAGERAPELRVSYAVVPYVSLVAHLGFLHWVFRADFVAADLTPVLLGLTIALLRVKPTEFVQLAYVRGLQVVMPVVAVLLSLGAGEDLVFRVSAVVMPITPVVLALLAGPLVVSYCLAIRSLPYVAGGLVVAAMAVVFGPSLATIGGVVRAILRFVGEVIGWLVPRSNAGWGVVAVVGSFLMLGMGAVVSIFRAGPTEQR